MTELALGAAGSDWIYGRRESKGQIQTTFLRCQIQTSGRCSVVSREDEGHAGRSARLCCAVLRARLVAVPAWGRAPRTDAGLGRSVPRQVQCTRFTCCGPPRPSSTPPCACVFESRVCAPTTDSAGPRQSARQRRSHRHEGKSKDDPAGGHRYLGRVDRYRRRAAALPSDHRVPLDAVAVTSAAV